jgi:DNA-binding transcriptional regulator YiaG
MTPREVQTLRRQFGWTQLQLATALGVTVTTVARWEQGARRVTPLVKSPDAAGAADRLIAGPTAWSGRAPRLRNAEG